MLDFVVHFIIIFFCICIVRKPQETQQIGQRGKQKHNMTYLIPSFI